VVGLDCVDRERGAREGKSLANSLAAPFLTTEAVVAEKPEKEKAPAGMPDGGDMDF
jgi:chaperonin GroEL